MPPFIIIDHYLLIRIHSYKPRKIVIEAVGQLEVYNKTRILDALNCLLSHNVQAFKAQFS